MKICKNCAHIDVCARWKNSEIDSCTLSETLRAMEQSEACNLFESKITRCNECKYFHQDGGGMRPGFCTNPHFAVVVQSENVTRWNCASVTPNDFCSFAESKISEREGFLQNENN